MSIRLRLSLSFLLVVALGFYLADNWIVERVRKSYLESMEESLVDMANMLASLVATRLEGEEIRTEQLRSACEEVYERRFQARIYELVKTHVDTRVTVTDADGIVLFDSAGQDEGRDYSRWRDVRLTLQGEYSESNWSQSRRAPWSSPTGRAAWASGATGWLQRWDASET